jgi:hypothetical protein
MLPGWTAEDALERDARRTDRPHVRRAATTYAEPGRYRPAQLNRVGSAEGDPDAQTIHCPGCILWNGKLVCC